MRKASNKIIGILLISVVSLIVVGCASEDAATLLVSQFRDYIEKKDGEGLYESAIVDKGTTWTVDDAANVVTMLKDDEEETAEIMAVLAAQAQHYDGDGEKNKSYDLYEDVTQVGPFYIDEMDDEHVLRVRSYDVTVITEPEATITFLGEKYVADEQGEVPLGKIGPGYYELTGTLETDDGIFEAEDNFFMFEFETFTPNVTLDFEIN